MNYLAHLFLAEDTAESLIGNLLGDFVKGSLESHKERYSEDILKGIETHRKADSFTDTHCIFRRSKQRLSKIHLQQTLVTIKLSCGFFPYRRITPEQMLSNLRAGTPLSINLSRLR
jgi:acyl carrier protein phosphodiesterase